MQSVLGYSRTEIIQGTDFLIVKNTSTFWKVSGFRKGDRGAIQIMMLFSIENKSFGLLNSRKHRGTLLA